MAFSILLAAYVANMSAYLFESEFQLVVLIISLGLMAFSVFKLAALNKSFKIARIILYALIALRVVYSTLYMVLKLEADNDTTTELIAFIIILAIEMVFTYFLLKGIQEYFDDELTLKTSKRARICWYLILSNIVLQIVSGIFSEQMNEYSITFVLLVNTVASFYLIFLLILAVQSDKLLRSTRDKR